jgi:phosphoglycerate dehydrogenase-like enzyme
LGLDVYEEEAQLFFEDRSDLPLQDDVLARLLTFPNVIITAHQAFLTREALSAIAATTLANIAAWAGSAQNLIKVKRPRLVDRRLRASIAAYLEDPWSNTISATTCLARSTP